MPFNKLTSDGAVQPSLLSNLLNAVRVVQTAPPSPPPEHPQSRVGTHTPNEKCE